MILPGLTAFTEANKKSIGVGNLVLALGRPGKTVQATMGIVSAYGGNWRTHSGGQIDHYLQTDLVMYPGFSGGPLVNAEGHLLGFNSSYLMRGVSLAVPTSTVASVAESLLAHGHVKKGYLGVSTQQVRLPDAAREELKQKRGLLVISVESGSPADSGGLTLGDTIVGIEETAVQNHDHLLSQLGSDRIGKKVALKILRGGKNKKAQRKSGRTRLMSITILKELDQELTAVVKGVQPSLVQLTHGRRGIGAGTIWHEDGLILTNAHVAQRKPPKAVLWDGRTYQTTILAADPKLDLAALSIEASNLPTIPLGDSKSLKPGQWVTSIGHPWGIKGAASFGNVIAMGVPIEWNQNGTEMVQVGIQLRPGHSGGPMVDAYGRLVGINTMISGPQVGLAVPVHVAIQFLEETVGHQVVQLL